MVCISDCRLGSGDVGKSEDYAYIVDWDVGKTRSVLQIWKLESREDEKSGSLGCIIDR